MDKDNIPILVYKIRRKSDGLYSNGGQEPIFSKRGKIWMGVGDIKNHFNVIRKCHTSKKYLEVLYKGCEIVTFILNPMDRVDVNEFVSECK
jgi:hypothetical protein